MIREISPNGILVVFSLFYTHDIFYCNILSGAIGFFDDNIISSKCRFGKNISAKNEGEIDF